MKIIADENVFIVPLENKKTIIVANGYKKELLECLTSYFISKKKNKCVIYDEDEQVINMGDINFLYIPEDLAVDSNLSLKSKTILNNNISEIINENPKLFLSLERLRNELTNMQSDNGFYKLTNILNAGLTNKVSFQFSEFSISNIIQMYEIFSDSISESEKQLVIMNLLLYENKNRINVVFLDRLYDDITEKWINCHEDTYFIVDNDAIAKANDDYELLILSNHDHLVTGIESNTDIKTLSYMNHDIIRANLELQNQKNIDLYNKYFDINTTFFIKNDHSMLLNNL